MSEPVVPPDVQTILAAFARAGHEFVDLDTMREVAALTAAARREGRQQALAELVQLIVAGELGELDSYDRRLVIRWVEGKR